MPQFKAIRFPALTEPSHSRFLQGSATKPTQKSLPQKHGLQSLGKVPTARRAPANLPSLKAENGGSGNDAAGTNSQPNSFK